MREIKFRAWDSELKVMKRPSVNMMIDTFNATCYWMFGYDIEIMGKLELMQFTGLKDKNGKEIYEGDIVLRKDLMPHYVITWINNSGGWFLVDRNMRQPLSDIYSKEIIGNIHENPELLDSK